MAKFVLDIEKYLAHQVNELCYNYDGSWDSDFYGPQKFNESIGIPLVLIHKNNLPARGKDVRKEYTVGYHMVDLEDFIDFATSDLAPDFKIQDFPDKHVFYYQALPGTETRPVFNNEYSSFSVMAVCLSRIENNLWVNMQFRVSSSQLSNNKNLEIKDLVGKNHGFAHEFVTIHFMDQREEAFSPHMKAYLQKKNKNHFDKGLPPEPVFEFTKSHIVPPFKSNDEYYNNNEYRIRYSGNMWTDIAEMWSETDFSDEAPKDWVEFLKSEKDRLKTFENYNNRILAENFEIARLMIHLPSYLAFMYDLVKTEKKKVDLPQALGRTKSKKRPKKRSIYKIVKSLRVIYDAEEDTKKKLNITPRTWTAPAYRYAVRGHWRVLSQPWHKGHDPDGNELLAKTWVREYEKGKEKDKLYAIETRDPKVTINVKQTLSYAVDVIKSYDQKKQTPSSASLNSLPQKPSKEWMYLERSKLTAGLRWIILKRDNFQCKVCGKGAENGVKLEIDHIIPIEKWGLTEESNLRSLCKECNRGKSNKI